MLEAQYKFSNVIIIITIIINIIIIIKWASLIIYFSNYKDRAIPFFFYRNILPIKRLYFEHWTRAMFDVFNK